MASIENGVFRVGQEGFKIGSKAVELPRVDPNLRTEGGCLQHLPTIRARSQWPFSRKLMLRDQLIDTVGAWHGKKRHLTEISFEGVARKNEEEREMLEITLGLCNL